MSWRLQAIRNERCVYQIDNHVFMKDEAAVLEHLLDPIKDMQFLEKRLGLPFHLCRGRTCMVVVFGIVLISRQEHETWRL